MYPAAIAIHRVLAQLAAPIKVQQKFQTATLKFNTFIVEIIKKHSKTVSMRGERDVDAFRATSTFS